MVDYEYAYPGSYSMLGGKYGSLGSYGSVMPGNNNYSRVSAGSLGGTTSIQTSNQLGEVTKLLNQGIKTTEVSTIQAETFEMIPKEHLKEIYRLNKLTGAESTLHAPIIDPSGFSQQGWDETNRLVAEKQFTDVITRAHELNPRGNIPVTIHASSIQGTEHIPGEKGGEETQRMIAVNRDTGQLTPLIRELKYIPGMKGVESGEPELRTPERLLESANDSQWVSQITNLAFYKKEADEVMQGAIVDLAPTQIHYEQTGEFRLTPDQENAYRRLERANLFLDNVEQSFNNLFDNALKYSDKNPELKKELISISKNWRELQEDAQTKKLTPISFITQRSRLIDESLNNLKHFNGPEILAPVEQFVKEKASQTLGNVAFSGYKKYGSTAPIVSVENPPYGSAVSRANDLKELIEESRRVFVNKAVKEGMGKSEAERAAKMTIGATWDTSHIAMLRKQGFDNKKLVEEAEKIAPFVKHVHLNDNFGSTHTDLPPGMGNVPINEVLEKLKKVNFEGKFIFEGGNFFQNFQQSPHPYVLEGLGSPIFVPGAGGGYWNEAIRSHGNYFAGYGTVLPEQHFSMYGGGFSALPTELGGQIQRRGSGFSGTPME